MSIANALICAAMFYGFLVLLGHATIAYCRHQGDSLETCAISPIIGLAVLTLLTTYLSILGIPLSAVATNIALVIAILAIITLATRPIPSSNRKRIFLEYWIPLSTTVMLVALPFIYGGYQFVILRGNGTDSFNYINMADALSRYPLDWILAQTKETLAFHSPNLPLAQDLLKTRWSTSALLAFASSAFGISPVEFEYVFTLTLMVILYNAFVAALSATSSLNRLTIWLPVVFIVGFWGQFTTDLRAFSQIAALPILVVLIGWLLSQTDRAVPIFRYGVLLTGILSAALFLQYPEIVVAFLPGTGLVFLIRLWRIHREKRLTKDDAKALIAGLFVTLLLCAPLIKFVVGFAVDQGRFAVNKSPGWERAYFAWMKNPIRGLWGAGINPSLDPFFDNIFAVIALIISIILTLSVAVRIIKYVISRQQWRINMSESQLFLLAISGFVGAIVLVARENSWAAGKVISYFSVLIPIWMAICLTNEKLKATNSRLKKASHYTLTMAILVWGAMNFVFAGARISHAVNGSEYIGYIGHHGEYRRVSAEAAARIPYINCPVGSSVAIYEPTVWGREFLTHVVEGRGYYAITPGYSQSRSAEPDRHGIHGQINCAVADRKYFDASYLPPKGSNLQEFYTGQPGDQFAALIGLSGGYGMGMNYETATRYVLTGQEDVLITFLARSSAYSVLIKLCSGSTRAANESLTVFIDVDGKRVSEHVVSECVSVNIDLAGNKESIPQQVRLTSKDPRPNPTLIGTDPRDIRLRVEVISVVLK